MENTKLGIKATAFAAAILWGLSVLAVGAINRWVSPNYGIDFLRFASSVYPGYHALTGGKSVIIGTGYALVDGAVGGALFAWVYNFCSGRCCKK